MRYYRKPMGRKTSLQKPLQATQNPARIALRRQLFRQEQRDKLHGQLRPIALDSIEPATDDCMEDRAHEADGTHDHDESATNRPKKRSSAPKRTVETNLTKEIQKMTQEALANTETLHYFNFRAECTAGERAKNQPPDTMMTIEHDLPWTLASADGVNLVHYLPKLVKPRAQRELTHTIMEYAKNATISTKYWKPKEFGESPNDYSGHIALVRGWHGVGRTDLNAVPSSSLVHSGKGYMRGCQVFQDLSLLSHRVNEIIHYLDPVMYDNLHTLRARMDEDPGFAALNKIDTLLMEGRELLFNTHKAAHFDRYDPPLGWAVLVALGSFKGGYVRMLKLGYRVRLEPGDGVLLRGRIIEHEIEPFEGGPRINVPHFTHASLWAEYDLEHLVDPSLDK